MKILIIEDEKRIAKNIHKGLTLQSHIVDVAYDGEKGLDLAVAEKYDIIILDRMLPKMNGINICKTLRKEKITTPIIMLTAKSQIDDKVDGLDAGADDYLTKPFAFKELLARIYALARRPQHQTSSVLQVNDLILDPVHQNVTRNSTTIDLTKQEFALLEFLMRNKNQTFSKEQLVERVWNFDADILPNTVQVYIGYLRNKIDKPFPKKKPLIKTVRGFGYTIHSEN